AAKQLPLDTPFILKGSGGMAKDVAGAMSELGFKHGTILARNPQTGPLLAERYNYQWRGTEQDCSPATLLINVTPIGMTGGDEQQQLAFSPERLQQATLIFDVVANPIETPLIRYAKAHQKAVISGADVAVLQAAEQFILYTGHE